MCACHVTAAHRNDCLKKETGLMRLTRGGRELGQAAQQACAVSLRKLRTTTGETSCM